MAPRKALPKETKEVKPVPEHKEVVVELPQVGVPENTVQFGDTLIEIKPTKMRYLRDRTLNFYKILDIYPLVEILSWGGEAFEDGRDGDKCVMDWLIAVTNDPQLVKKNYNNIDVDTVENMLLIFKRLNRLEEKEQARKNLERERTQVPV